MQSLLVIKKQLATNETLRQVLLETSLVERVYQYTDIDSTMNEARRLISMLGPNHGTLIVSDYQSAGRGRHGRSWSASPGTALLAALILDRSELPGTPDLIQTSLLASALPVAVCRGIIPFVPEARIKYPNDIVVADRKLGGLLIEATSEAVVFGFGINCTQDLDNLPVEVKMPASSIFLETGAKVSKDDVLVSILSEVTAVLDSDCFLSSAGLMNAMCETIGREIVVDLGNETVSGIADSIAPDGCLILKTANGTKALYSSQIVRTWFPYQVEGHEP